MSHCKSPWIKISLDGQKEDDEERREGEGVVGAGRLFERLEIAGINKIANKSKQCVDFSRSRFVMLMS